MGTRADFYVGRGESAEWLGSIACDGYPDGVPMDVRRANTEEEYRAAVAAFFSVDPDFVSLPADGWPWPWEDSRTTDYAYAFDGGQVYAAGFGHRWWPADEPEPNDDDDGEERPKECVFPKMDTSRFRRPGTAASGVIVASRR